MFDKDNKFGFISNNESNNNIEGLDKVKTDLNNIKSDLGDKELTTTNKDIKVLKDIAKEKPDQEEKEYQKELQELEKLEKEDQK